LMLDHDSTFMYVFTEADEYISYQRIGDNRISIKCSFSDGVLLVPIEEFAREVCAFARRKVGHLGREYPALMRHPAVRDLLQKCDGERELGEP
jgi:hypothetical protein